MRLQKISKTLDIYAREQQIPMELVKSFKKKYLNLKTLRKIESEGKIYGIWMLDKLDEEDLK